MLSPGPFTVSVTPTLTSNVPPLKPNQLTIEIVTSCVNGIASLPRSSKRKSNIPPEIKVVSSCPISTRSSSRSSDLTCHLNHSQTANIRFGSLSTFTPSHTLPPNLRLSPGIQPLKKRKVKGHTTPITYPFFGTINAPVPKVIALRCLEFLSGKDFYSLSVTSSLWDTAAKDDALWET